MVHEEVETTRVERTARSRLQGKRGAWRVVSVPEKPVFQGFARSSLGTDCLGQKWSSAGLSALGGSRKCGLPTRVSVRCLARFL